jgi:metal-responsive CopG/Arc/MetJ family transcriptional regulator
MPRINVSIHADALAAIDAAAAKIGESRSQYITAAVLLRAAESRPVLTDEMRHTIQVILADLGKLRDTSDIAQQLQEENERLRDALQRVDKALGGVASWPDTLAAGKATVIIEAALKR